ncbi:MAG: Acetyl-CoA acetyltransferase, partial [uncultured Blastococcus sp.]
ARCGHLRAAAHPGGGLRRFAAGRARAGAGGDGDPGADGAHGSPARVGGRRAAGALLPDDGRAGDRPRGRAGRRPARHRLRHPDRPALRVGSAGGPLRRDAGAVRRLRPRPRGRRRVDEQRAVLLHRHAVGRQGRTGRAAAGRPGPRPGHRRWPQPPGARRHARDRGEPAPRVRDLPRGAGRVQRPQPPAGGVRGRGRPVRRRDRARDGSGPHGRHRRRPRRAHPPRLEPRHPGQAPSDHGPGRSGGDRHRGQRERAERRRGRRDRHPPRQGGRAGTAPAGPAPLVGRGRRAAGDDGHRPGPRDGEGAGPARSQAVGRRPDRAQRGVRLPGAGGVPGVGLHRRGLGAHERQRLRHLPRPSRGCDGRADPGDPAARDGPPRGPLRPGDHVHRRRAGAGRAVRAGVGM